MEAGVISIFLLYLTSVVLSVNVFFSTAVFIIFQRCDVTSPALALTSK